MFCSSAAFLNRNPEELSLLEFLFWLLKVESVENPTLSKIFDLKKQQLGSSITQRMLQLIPAHFCVMVSHIGFQAEFAPPDGNSLLAAILYFNYYVTV